MEKMMIGIYDINTCSTLTYKERLDIYKLCGFKEVALYLDNKYQINNEDYLDIIRYARDIRLQISQVHIDWKISNLICDSSTDEYFKYVERKLNEAHNLKIPYVIAHASQTNTPPKINSEQLEKFKNMMLRVKEKNVYLCLENVRDNDNLDKILSLNLDNVKVCFDMGHAHCYGNEKELFEKYKEKIICSHLHNNYGKDTHEPLDSGEIDYKYFIQQLSMIQKVSNCLECFPPRDNEINKENFIKFIMKCHNTIKDIEQN